MSEDELRHRETMTVPEKWWHRLLRVFLYGSTGILALAALVFLAGQSRGYSYAYSFEEGFQQAPGRETPCSFPGYVECGEFGSAADFVAYYVEVKKEGQPRVSEAIRELRKRGYGDYELAKHLIEDGDLRVRETLAWNPNLFIKGLPIVAALVGGWFLLALFLYRVILYIAHGRAKVVSP